MDQHNRIMAAILTRFRNIINAATEPLSKTATIPQASLNLMTLNNETSAMIKEVENLLALSREIKMLWIAGPLQKPGDAGEKNREKMLDEKAHEVSRLWEELERLIIEKENGMRAYPTPAATATTTAMGSNSSQQAPTTTAGGGNVKVEADDDQTLVGSVSA